MAYYSGTCRNIIEKRIGCVCADLRLLKSEDFPAQKMAHWTDRQKLGWYLCGGSTHKKMGCVVEIQLLKSEDFSDTKAHFTSSLARKVLWAKAPF